jgi:hypothetical protein
MLKTPLVSPQLLCPKETLGEHACDDIESVFCLFDFIEESGIQKKGKGKRRSQ